MKILCVGDTHFRYELPYSSVIPDGRRSEWEAVKNKIIETSKDCDAIVLLGDNFNLRHNNSTVIKEFIQFLNGFGDKEVHILCGNHERYGLSSAIDFLKHVKNTNWFIYTEPRLTVVAGQEAFMIPFMSPALLGAETKEEGLKNLLAMFPKDAEPLAFCHLGVTGAKLHGVSADFFNEIVLPKEVMEKHFWHSFLGHWHSKQMLFPSTYICGNVFSSEVGDHSKSIWTYESKGTIDIEVKEIPLPVRPIHKLEWVDDAETRFASVPDNAIVKCYVTTKGTDLELVKKVLSRFDANMIIEKYSEQREKIHFEGNLLDLSIESILKMYAESKKLEYADLQSAFELINQK
jgi:hypothetical protein